jgi:hypothetical protein
MHKLLAVVPLLGLIVGCAHETRVYDIAVKNQTPHPITLVLEKEAGPREDAWITPEEVANGPARDNLVWGLGVVPAGKAAVAKRVKGEFDAGSRAWLRVYEGDLSVGDMLKIKAGTPARTDVPILPGKNDFLVRPHGDGIEVGPAPDK